MVLHTAVDLGPSLGSIILFFLAETINSTSTSSRMTTVGIIYIQNFEVQWSGYKSPPTDWLVVVPIVFLSRLAQWRLRMPYFGPSRSLIRPPPRVPCFEIHARHCHFSAITTHQGGASFPLVFNTLNHLYAQNVRLNLCGLLSDELARSHFPLMYLEILHQYSNTPGPKLFQRSSR